MTNYRSDQLDRARIWGWFVYVVAEEGGAYSKIGTAANPKYRLESLRNGNPRPLVIAATWRLASRDEAFKLEKAALVAMGIGRSPGRDWVRTTPSKAIEAVERELVRLGFKMWVEAA